MSETNGSALVYLLPQDVARVVDAWRQRYDPHIHYIPPHVTVAYPPFVSEQEWGRLRAQMVECVSAVREFDLRLAATGVFTSPQKVLWLRPDDGGNFTRLHDLLADRFPAYAPDSELAYVPHVTIGFFETLDALNQARAIVDAELQPQQALVAQLTLMQNISEGVWMVRDQINLAAG